MNLKRLAKICSVHNKNLKISYNIMKGFFKFDNDGNIEKDTIEGKVLESFIDKYNLTTEWTDEEMTWGSKDEKGTFNGVVGRVIMQVTLSN